MGTSRVLSLLLLFSLLLLKLFVTPSSGLNPEYAKAWEKQLRFIEMKNVTYRDASLGAPYDDPAKGLNCTSYVWLAAKWAGIPGVHLTTSNRLSMGLDGWSSVVVPGGLRDAEELDLGFATFYSTKPNGHTLVFLRTKDGLPGIAHASSGKKRVVIEEVAKWLERKLTRVRRLTIGDGQDIKMEGR